MSVHDSRPAACIQRTARTRNCFLYYTNYDINLKVPVLISLENNFLDKLADMVTFSNNYIIHGTKIANFVFCLQANRENNAYITYCFENMVHLTIF